MIQFFIRLKENRIAKNLFALGFFQLTNYLLPLLFVPYLVKTIGVEKFGLVSFSQAIMSVLAVITDYGFNLISTRDISLNRADRNKVSEIYSITLMSKALLGIITFVIVLVGIRVIPQLREHSDLHLLAFSYVVGQIFFPVWLFQGLEKMKYITYLNILSKTITLIGILIFIRSSNDFIFVLPSYALGSIVASFAAIYIVKKHFAIEFVFHRISRIKESLFEGSAIFISNVSLTVYNATTIIILGAFSNDVTVGYYSIAEKIIMVPRQILGVFSQAIYPQICQLSAMGYESVRTLWKKLFPWLLSCVFVFCLAVYFCAEELVLLISGSRMDMVTLLVKLLSFAPFIIAFNIPSYLSLLAFDFKSQCLKVLVVASVANIILNTLLSRQFGAVGTALALLSTETIISFGLFFILRKSINHLNTSYGNL